jgi:hypothetical protein
MNLLDRFEKASPVIFRVLVAGAVLTWITMIVDIVR